MTKIVISEFMDQAAVEDLRRDFAVVYDGALVDDPARLRLELANADALIIRNRTQVNAALLEAAPGLKAIGRLGVGLDNIDLDACAASDVKVLPATGANDRSVAEYVLTCTMVLLRGAYFGRERLLLGEWPRAGMMSGRELSGKVLGLVGYGSIARETGALAQALGMEVIAMDPFVAKDNFGGATRVETLAALTQNADVLSLHVPLTPETCHLVNAGILSMMKPAAIVINAARGGVIDELALVAALKSGRIGGAALDVFETEPMTAASSVIYQDAPNLILTPHIAGLTQESNVRVSALTAANVRMALAKTS